MMWMILVLEKPDRNLPDANNPWILFSHMLDTTTKPPPGVERPSENIWLIPLDSALSYAGRVMASAEPFHIPYKFCVVEKELQWHHSLQSS